MRGRCALPSLVLLVSTVMLFGCRSESTDTRMNRTPGVQAGPDQTLTLPSEARLIGTIVDDGLPEGATLTASWMLVSGPAPVWFSDDSQAQTTVTFIEPGEYVLRLTGTDSQLTGSDELRMAVLPPGVICGDFVCSRDRSESASNCAEDCDVDDESVDPDGWFPADLEPPPCDPNIESCATPEDDPGDTETESELGKDFFSIIKKDSVRPLGQPSTVGAVLGRFARYCGKVNIHQSPNGAWTPDSDCTSGCNIGDLSYCQKFWPSSTGIRQVSISSKPNDVWRNAGCAPVIDDWDGHDEFECVSESPSSSCGDGLCDSDETEASCPADCDSSEKSRVLPIRSASACACASDNGVTTPCEVELRILKFTATDSPWGDRRAEFSFGFTVEGVEKWFTWGSEFPAHVEVNKEIIVDRHISVVRVPCGQTQTVPVSLQAREADLGTDEKADLVLNLPISCPTTGRVTTTHSIELKNRRGKTKHRVNLTLETVRANTCSDSFTPRTCTVRPDVPPLACEYDLQLVSMYHRDSPRLDKQGSFYMNIGSVQDWHDWLKRGKSLSFDYKNYGKVSVPCNTTAQPAHTLDLTESDIGRDDIGSAQVNHMLSCSGNSAPITPLVTTGVDLYGHANKPRHKVDVSTRAELRNNNFCRKEPPEGWEVACRYRIDYSGMREVKSDGAFDWNGEYTLHVSLREAMQTYSNHTFPRVPNDGWTETPSNSFIDEVFVPCGKSLEYDVVVHAFEGDVSTKDEYGSNRRTLSLGCRPGSFTSREVIPLDLKNPNGGIRHKIEVAIATQLLNGDSVCACTK